MLIVTLKRPAYVAISAVLLLTTTIWLLSRSSNTYNQARSSRGWFRNLVSSNKAISQTHDEVFSVSTQNGAYFNILFGDQEAINPNILPHPSLPDTWIIVAQLQQDTQFFSEIHCHAKFQNDTLRCMNHAAALPIATTFGDKCTGDLAILGLNKGPHDARVFYGPHSPYLVFGSNSRFVCFGQFIQDFRSLVEWGYENFHEHDFKDATELQRNSPWRDVEKNWFLFFDQNDEPHVHYDVSPRRSYAKLDPTGEVGADLGSLTASRDEKCLDRYMPTIGPTLESIHQATNSLRITLCKRNDRGCTPDLTNTFILTIFQHKTYFGFHAVYEPYVMLFEQTAPFQTHAISRKPFWIHGRKKREKSSDSNPTGQKGVQQTTEGHAEEMFYVTSVSWKDPRQKYHGYIDDVLFISFGIEDKRSAAIDVVAGDLLKSIGTC